LFQDEIFVFTPRGDLIRLPSGATALDFAFALHSEIGQHCSGSKVNGRIVPLNTELHSGEWVEILTNSNKHPSPGWLNFVKTAKARSLVRRWIKRQHFDESRALGLDMIARVEKQLGRKTEDNDRESLVSKFHQRDWDHLLAALGSGAVSLHSVHNFFGLAEKKKKDRKPDIAKKSLGVTIQGMEHLLVKFAQCCKPLPGDDIVGFITRGRGVIVHRSDCQNIRCLGEDDKRAIQVEWIPIETLSFVASIRVEAQDRKNLLIDITSAIAKSNCGIRSANILTDDDIAIDDFNVDVKDLKDLQNLMKKIRKVKGVSRVIRLDMRSPKKKKQPDR
ncbi:MAG: bifunctional (p)ppGpp synthetase/guanosine-3',5'-bis(diphosphate) 3'-pyrophosphohydrolase, partial [Candidatus Latescibacteria bacterium]|nr:bifunctional (p)ppGpp synthetase/guanosine-3',5'-bis(diphosphate) 3'-pyrophosphohydrolase [Candidatus Latescibacterota bacterium]